MSIAEDKQADPDDTVRTYLDELQRVSSSSKSEARSTLVFEDGSALDFVSREGADTTMQAREATEEETAQLQADIEDADPPV